MQCEFQEIEIKRKYSKCICHVLLKYVLEKGLLEVEFVLIRIKFFKVRELINLLFALET